MMVTVMVVNVCFVQSKAFVWLDVVVTGTHYNSNDCSTFDLNTQVDVHGDDDDADRLKDVLFT